MSIHASRMFISLKISMALNSCKFYGFGGLLPSLELIYPLSEESNVLHIAIQGSTIK